MRIDDFLTKYYPVMYETIGEDRDIQAYESKLKEDVSPEKVLNIILWMSEGFMRTRTPEQLADLPKLNEEFLDHIELLRRQVYKPEFLEEKKG